MAFRSRQRKHGGGKFKSENQRRAMWANAPRAARKWAHNRRTNKSDWIGMGRTRPSVRGTARRARGGGRAGLRGAKAKSSSRRGGLFRGGRGGRKGGRRKK